MVGFSVLLSRKKSGFQVEVAAAIAIFAISCPRYANIGQKGDFNLANSKISLLEWATKYFLRYLKPGIQK